MAIRIFLIDEHRQTGEMLARRLSRYHDLNVVGSTDDAEKGLSEIGRLHPNIVLLEVKMKKADGMEICRRVSALEPKAKVAVLTSYLDPVERRTAYQAGAKGYLLKQVDTSELVESLRLLICSKN